VACSEQFLSVFSGCGYLNTVFSRGHSANTPHSPFDIFDFSTPWLDRSVRLTGVGKNAATQSANMAPRHLYFWFEHGGMILLVVQIVSIGGEATIESFPPFT
jgi:hypothetical protein